MLGRGWIRHTSKNATFFFVLANVSAIVCRYYKGTTGRNCSHNLCRALTCRLFCMLLLSLPPPRFSRIDLNCSFARACVCCVCTFEKTRKSFLSSLLRASMDSFLYNTCALSPLASTHKHYTTTTTTRRLYNYKRKLCVCIGWVVGKSAFLQ